MKWPRRLIALFQVVLAAACAPIVKVPGPAMYQSRLESDAVLTSDGATLPLRSWLPAGRIRAVVVALHGMNDYSHAFEEPGKYLAERGIAVYAYDQRGFGHAPNPGYWAGQDAMADDLKVAAQLVAARHPGVPLYILGESMGGAVAMLTMSRPDAPPAAGVILSAPAVWGRADMNLFQRSVLFLSSYTVPWLTLTGHGLHITPSDNIPMLEALSRDPVIIKETRVDTIHGVCDLMDAAAQAAPHLHGRVLMLYGEKDQVVPASATHRVMRQLPDGPPSQIRAIYPNGYHMLLRDLEAHVVLDDIVSWILHPVQPLPSRADAHAAEVLRRRGH